jgi:hypothetical protein
MRMVLAIKSRRKEEKKRNFVGKVFSLLHFYAYQFEVSILIVNTQYSFYSLANTMRNIVRSKELKKKEILFYKEIGCGG